MRRGYERRLAPQHMQGRAIALVGVGQPIAQSLGCRSAHGWGPS